MTLGEASPIFSFSDRKWCIVGYSAWQFMKQTTSIFMPIIFWVGQGRATPQKNSKL